MRGYLQALVARSTGRAETIAPRPVAVFESAPSWMAAEPDAIAGLAEPATRGVVEAAGAETESLASLKGVPGQSRGGGDIPSGQTDREQSESPSGKSPLLGRAKTPARPSPVPSGAQPAALPDHDRVAIERTDTPEANPKAPRSAKGILDHNVAPEQAASANRRSVGAEPAQFGGDVAASESNHQDTHRTMGHLRWAESEPARLESTAVPRRHAQIYASIKGDWPAEMPLRADNSREEKTVHVSIGRIEVRLSSLVRPQPQAKPVKNGAPAMTLDRYLRRRGGGE